MFPFMEENWKYGKIEVEGEILGHKIVKKKRRALPSYILSRSGLPGRKRDVE